DERVRGLGDAEARRATDVLASIRRRRELRLLLHDPSEHGRDRRGWAASSPQPSSGDNAGCIDDFLERRLRRARRNPWAARRWSGGWAARAQERIRLERERRKAAV